MVMLWVGPIAFARAQDRDKEVAYPNEAFAKLDTFEGHRLNQADKTFNQKNYRQATAEYDSFILEFPKSAALPYALFRKARSLQLDGKRFEAVRQYNEVLDYFPNEVPFAAPASFQIGQCHVDNGEVEKAIKAWAKMADDKDYSKHPLAAQAINRLAGYVAPKDPARAVEYYRQVSLEFRTRNVDASGAAINAVIGYYVRTKPDPAKLREFYEQVRTFNRDPSDPGKDAATDWHYWSYVRQYVRQFGTFPDEKQTERDAYYQFWVGQLDGRFPTNDDYVYDVANLRNVFERDGKKWLDRLDKQFKDYQKEGDYSRVTKFISWIAGNREKVNEYYANYNFDKMSPDQIVNLMWVCYDNVRDVELARSVFAKIPIKKFTDAEKDGKIYQHLQHRDGKPMVDLCMSYENRDYGKLQLLRYYHGKNENAKGIELATELANVPDYAKSVMYMKGEMQQRIGKYDEAIASYRLADNPPTNIYRIAECMAAQGKVDMAVGQYREIENFFKQQAPDAAMRIAQLYKQTGQKEKHIAALKAVLSKYPESSQSSQAHLELEALGIKKFGGGKDAE